MAIDKNGGNRIGYYIALAARERIERTRQEACQRRLCAYWQRQDRARVMVILSLAAVVAAVMVWLAS
jgi:hypothetical protein